MIGFLMCSKNLGVIAVSASSQIHIFRFTAACISPLCRSPDFTKKHMNRIWNRENVSADDASRQDLPRSMQPSLSHSRLMRGLC